MTETYDDSENKLTPNIEAVYYYTECPHCGFEFAFQQSCKKAGSDEEFNTTIPDDDDIIKIYCPLCGKLSLIEVAKTPTVMLESQGKRAWIVREGENRR